MKDFIHFVTVPFTGLGLKGGYRGDAWFKYRIGLFKKYTLNSLRNQTCKDFILWLAFRPEEKENPICQEFYKWMSINVLEFPFIFTYGGIPIWDDKYKNDNLLERLQRSLPELKKFLGEEKWVYETCQPSDDVYHLQEMAEINKQEPQEALLIHDRGFILNEETQRLAEWNPIINPPFHTVMFPAEVFFDPQRHFDYMKNSMNHEDIVRLFKTVKLPDRRYCVVVHGKNISTNWWHPFRGKEFEWSEGKEILKQFGMNINPPSKAVGGVKEAWIKLRYKIFKFLIFIKFYKIAKYVKNQIEFRILHKAR